MPPAFLNQEYWRLFREAQSPAEFAGSWLDLQVSMIESVQSAVIILSKDGQSYAPVKWWPDESNQDEALTSVAELAVKQRRGIVNDASQQSSHTESGYLAYPFIIDGNLYGVVALKIQVTTATDMSVAMRQLQWGVAWLELLYRREHESRPSRKDDRLQYLLDTIALSLEHRDFKPAATAVASELASALRFERVSIGFWKNNIVEVEVLSHNASFSEKANLIETISLAMTESVDQLKSIVYPPINHTDFSVSISHEQLLRQNKVGSVCTVPVRDGGQVVGAITFEALGVDSINKNTLFLCEAIASFVGSILYAKRNAEQTVLQHAVKATTSNLSDLTGTEHPFKKILFFSASILLLFMVFFDGRYRVAADMRLEGEIQRVVTAAIDGYVDEAYVRAGDVVKKGQLLYKLDDTELRLERINVISQREQYIKQYRDARAKSERAQINVIKAQMEQSRARLGLVEEQLLRISGVAPFDGIIVSGDLSQSLGAPVSQGDLLFEVAPLNAYRVILEVDESDINNIEAGQTGQLLLASGLDRELQVKISRITPVAITREGRNFFEVEAQVIDAPEFLRPGLKGIAKIDVGEQNILWIWTHTLTDWLHLWLWRYLP